LRNLPTTWTVPRIQSMSCFDLDAANLVEAASGAEGEADEAREARVKRFQQQRLFGERQDASARLVLAALDAAERVADVS